MLRKLAVAVNTGGQWFQVLNALRSIGGGGNLCPLWLARDCQISLI